MNKITMFGLVGTAAAMTLAGVAPATADAKTAIDKPGSYCFQFGSTAPGGTRNVLALDIDPSDHPTSQKLWWASGFERATNADVDSENYVNNLNGTATLAKPNERKPGPKLIHLGLTGTGFGSNAGQGSGVWNIDYTLQLNRKTLKGKIVGTLVFTPVTGTEVGATSSFGVDDTVKPISCKKV